MCNTPSKCVSVLISTPSAAHFLPADISVVGPSTVTEGDRVEFTCTVSKVLQTIGDCQFIQSYLEKNKIILQVQAFNVTAKMVTFVLEGALLTDSGNYSCLLLPSVCLEKHEQIIVGKEAVSLEVKGKFFTSILGKYF